MGFTSFPPHEGRGPAAGATGNRNRDSLLSYHLLVSSALRPAHRGGLFDDLSEGHPARVGGSNARLWCLFVDVHWSSHRLSWSPWRSPAVQHAHMNQARHKM